MISQFGQSLGVRGVDELAHAYLDGKFLEIVSSFDHASPGGQTAHHDCILEDEIGNHAAGTTSKANPVRRA